MSWNPLKKGTGQLSTKPQLSQGLATHEEDRELEINFNNLQGMEENSKRLYKEVRKYQECLGNLQKCEDKLASDLSSCNHEDAELKKLSDDYSSVVYQMGHVTDDLVQLSQRSVVDPMKKITTEFPNIQVAIKKRDLLLAECQRNHQKWEKLAKLEKTGNNIVKAEQAKRSYQLAKDDFDKANRLLLLELPQFYSRRIDYFQPCLQALIRSQVDYYGESTRLFTNLVSTTPDKSPLVSDEEYKKDIDNKLTQIRALSIAGN